MTYDADAIRAWTSRNLLARANYYADPTPEQLATDAARRRRKAAAQQRYRDRLKEQQK